MNILAALRERIRLVIGTAIGAFLSLACGALLVLVLSPQQAMLARRIERLPDLDAAAVGAAQTGRELLVTGHLQDNEIVDEGGFVAYTLEEWVVTPPTPDADGDDDGEAKGSWKTTERVVPDLTLNVEGQTVSILRTDNVRMSGPLHEELIHSDGWQEAKYDGEWLPEGSLRIRGLFNGDLVTVLGKKASSDGVIPDEMYAGDRVAFADSKHRAARGLLIGGICMIGLAPAILVGGVLGAIFGRRRRFR